MDVGVLLVHGIGDHAEGETLLGFGEPLVDWLREWMSGPGANGQPRGKVTVDAARLRATRNEAESPAYARVNIQGQPEGTHVPQQDWLFAEAWWGGSVQVPDTSRLLVWMLSRVPLLVMWHFYRGNLRELAREQANAPKGLGFLYAMWAQFAMWRAIARALGVLAFAAAMQGVIALALLLWLVPIGPWRQGLLAVVRVMTLTLGDSFVLLEQDVQRAAMVQRVKRTLAWLKDRCDQVVVVAHSQGGAIAHDALKASSLDKVLGLITVGSGLEKLEFLRMVREQRKGLMPALLSGPLLMSAAAIWFAHFMGWASAGADWWVGPASIFGLLGLVSLLALLSVLEEYRKDMSTRLDKCELKHEAQTLPWWDVRATMDLVPMGSGSLLAGKPFVMPVVLTNECSLVFDHISYFETRSGFAVWCWGTLARVAGLGRFSREEEAALVRMALWHRRRAWAMALGVSLSPAAVAVAVLLLTASMADFGGTLLDSLKASGPGWVADAASWSARQIARLIGLLPSLDNSDDAIQQRAQVVVAAVAALGAITLWWTIMVSCWRAANRQLWRRACAGQSQLTGRHHNWYGGPALVAWCAGAMAPLLVVALASWSPQALGPESIGRAAAILLAFFFASAGLAMGCGIAWIEENDAQRDAFGRWGGLAWPLLSMFSGTLIAASAYTLLENIALAPDGMLTWAAYSAVVALNWLLAVTLRLHSRTGWAWLAAAWLVPLLGALLVPRFIPTALTTELTLVWAGLAVLMCGLLRQRKVPVQDGA